jgi:hypothetical protein
VSRDAETGPTEDADPETENNRRPVHVAVFGRRDRNDRERDPRRDGQDGAEW